MLTSFKKSLAAAFLLLSLLSFGLSARAQSGNSTVVAGTVADPSGQLFRMQPWKFTIRLAGLIAPWPPTVRENSPSRTSLSTIITSPQRRRDLLPTSRTLTCGQLSRSTSLSNCNWELLPPA